MSEVAVEAPGTTGEPVDPASSTGQPGGMTEQPVPVIRVERGNPTPEQLAALTVVLSAAGGAPSPDGERLPRTLWTARSRFARPRPAVGPGGWRASALPR